MDIQTLKNKAEKDIAQAQNLAELDTIFRAYLGKKGALTQILRSLAGLSEAERKTQGKAANELRDFLQKTFADRERGLKSVQLQGQEKGARIDITAPGSRLPQGHLHPLTLVQRKACEIFQSMGFAIAEGPEIENERYNFDALNIPGPRSEE